MMKLGLFLLWLIYFANLLAFVIGVCTEDMHMTVGGGISALLLQGSFRGSKD